jgi:hypothetical protein
MDAERLSLSTPAERKIVVLYREIKKEVAPEADAPPDSRFRVE